MATISSPGPVVGSSAAAPSRWFIRRGHWLALAAAIVVLSWRFAEVRLDVLFNPSTAAAVWSLVAGLFPPDVSASFLTVVLRALGQTLATSVAATLLSIALALPLGTLATSTLWSRGILAAADGRGLRFRLLAVSCRVTRALLGFLRAVPDLVWALLFVSAVGLGPFAGTLALAVSYTGILGRVYADVFEHVDPRPLEALASTGAGRIQIFLRGVWPQAAAHVTAYTLYSFECCVRSAAVLGFVGAGGIGYEIFVSMRLFDYHQLLTLLLVLVALLTTLDAVSRSLRVSGFALGEPTLPPVGRTPLAASLWSGNLRKVVGGAAIVFFALISFRTSGFGAMGSTYGDLFPRMSSFVREMLPPELNAAFLRTLAVPFLQTIAIAILATAVGIVLAALLAVPATSTLMLVPADSPGKHGLLSRSSRRLAYWSSRSALNVLRSIPELVWVLICTVAIGIGPFSGTIALGLHTAGVLGKLYAETLEVSPARAVEALRSVGARPLQTLVWALWPQVRPILTSYTVLRWEMNLRASTLLGLVGGGGLGMVIYNDIQLGFYDRVGTLVLVIYGMVLASDWMSERLRLQIA